MIYKKKSFYFPIVTFTTIRPFCRFPFINFILMAQVQFISLSGYI
jgi:hypothetical protein